MSIPKITPHRRAILIEYDPYLRDICHTVYRRTYDDGSRALFVDDERVCSIRYKDYYVYTEPTPVALLDIADGADSVPINGVSIQECVWLEKSMEDIT